MQDNAVVISGHILAYLKGIILIPIIVKTVGVTVFGGFTLLTSILGIVFGISSFGAGFRSRRFLPSTVNMQVRAQLYYPPFFFQLGSTLLMCIFLVLVNGQIQKYIFKNEIKYSVYVIPAYLVTYFLYAQGSDYFRYTSRVHYMTLAGLAFPYMHIGLLVGFLYLFHSISINVLILSHAVAALLVALPCFYTIVKEIGMSVIFYRVSNLMSDIKVGVPLVLGFIVDFILAGSDRYFIAFYMSVEDVGFYTPGYAMGSFILFIPKAMGTALPQLLSKAVDNKDEHQAKQMLDYAIKIFLLLTIPFIFGSMVLGKSILTLLANREVAENAYWVTPIVAGGTLFYGLNIILSNVLFVRMKTLAIFQMNLVAALFNVIANAIVLYLFKSILVAAATTLASYLLAFIYAIGIVREKGWGVDFQRAVILKSIGASVFMVTVIHLAIYVTRVEKPLDVLLVGLLVGLAAYSCGVLALGTITKKEIGFVKLLVWKARS